MDGRFILKQANSLPRFLFNRGGIKRWHVLLQPLPATSPQGPHDYLRYLGFNKELHLNIHYCKAPVHAFRISKSREALTRGTLSDSASLHQCRWYLAQAEGAHPATRFPMSCFFTSISMLTTSGASILCDPSSISSHATAHQLTAER